ncbi:MAG: hypothetical protein E7184_02540 [Erysipelotrichaceae bacterium]|nr:hypothetical protein [Erysipelotrichaceae bacterium]
MAKRKSNTELVGILSFGALLVSGICKLLSLIGASLGLIATIGDALLLAAVLLAAYTYAMTLNKNWRIIYWIIAVVAIAGFVLTGFNIIK